MALTILEGSIDGLRHQGRPKRQWMDDIEEWSGCSYIQLKEMAQDREQWRRKTGTINQSINQTIGGLSIAGLLLGPPETVS